MYPDPVPGWTHPNEFSHDTLAHHGIVLAGSDIGYSSPVIAEIDGDTSNGKEIAVVGADGIVYVHKSSGDLLWSSQLPNYSCNSASSSNKAFSSPAVGALNGDGIPYVVVGYGGFGSGACGGGVVALNGASGSQYWHFDLKKFAKGKFYATSHSVFSSPALADVDGDGKLEVGFGSFDRSIYLLNSDGTLRWYYLAADTVWSSPSFADVDGDGKPEMIIGTDISMNKKIKPPTPNGGYMYALKGIQKKTSKGRVGFRQGGAYKWLTSFDQTLYSSPVVADVLPDNPGSEVIIGSGCYFPQHTSAKRGAWVKILSLTTGKVLRTLSTGACSSSQVAVGDLDGDGVLEVVATVNGSASVGGDGYGRVMAWKASSTTPMWSVTPYLRGRNDSSIGNFKSPIIADLDGNGSLEVIVSNGAGVTVLNGIDGRTLTCSDSSCADAQPFLNAFQNLGGTPAVGDVDGDGDLDLFVAGGSNWNGGHGMIYGWTNFQSAISSDPGSGTPHALPWPMLRGNPQHLGSYGQ